MTRSSTARSSGRSGSPSKKHRSSPTLQPAEAASRGRAQAGPGARRHDVARLVAMREGVKVVLAGTIAREGDGYAVTLRAVNPADGKQTWGGRAVRPQGRVSCRRSTGWRSISGSRSATRRPRRQARRSPSASLEAVHEYSIGQDLANAGRHEERNRALPHGGRARSEVRARVFRLGHGRVLSRPHRRSVRAVEEGARAARRHDRAREVPHARHLLPGHREELPEGDRELLDARPPVPDRPRGTQQPGLRLLQRPRTLRRHARKGTRPAGSTRRTSSSATTTRSTRCTRATSPRRRTRRGRSIELAASFFKNYLPLAIAALAAGDAPRRHSTPIARWPRRAPWARRLPGSGCRTC